MGAFPQQAQSLIVARRYEGGLSSQGPHKIEYPMLNRMHAFKSMRATSQDVELVEVGTEPTWQLIPLWGSVSTVINAATDGTVIGGDGQEIASQDASKGKSHKTL